MVPYGLKRFLDFTHSVMWPTKTSSFSLRFSKFKIFDGGTEGESKSITRRSGTLFLKEVNDLWVVKRGKGNRTRSQKRTVVSATRTLEVSTIRGTPGRLVEGRNFFTVSVSELYGMRDLITSPLPHLPVTLFLSLSIRFSWFTHLGVSDSISYMTVG